MYRYSKKSRRQLSTCNEQIVLVFSEVIKHVDCTIIEGWRSDKKQDEMFRTGASHLKAGESKHNKRPSRAVDSVIFPIDWDDWHRHYAFVGFVLGVGRANGVEMTSGLDWDRDWEFADQNFMDAAHFELVGP